MSPCCLGKGGDCGIGESQHHRVNESQTLVLKKIPSFNTSKHSLALANGPPHSVTSLSPICLKAESCKLSMAFGGSS